MLRKCSERFVHRSQVSEYVSRARGSSSTPDQMLNFGPIYDFWTFMTEHLNKILKNINNNHWVGGCLEISMMRGFGHETQFKILVSCVAFL